MQRISAVTWRAGDEPVPGYRLIEPLGQGGFGEVWKCEVPGGLFKAIKFVSFGDGASCPATQERSALERVKLIRHPFILSLERVEELDGTLVIIMELADQNMYSLHLTCREEGKPGIPRQELLWYLLEVAEALDWMNFEHGLQHLDIKPHNLFLLSGHVKVADFGLVHDLGDKDLQGSGGESVRTGGVTPMYSAPELLRGSLSRHCDQYSLAVVYQQLLTGTVPFWHPNVYELMMQHLSAEPDLAALSLEDQAIVARALAKSPEQRFGSCLEFVNALLGGKGPTLRRSGAWKKMIGGRRETSSASPTPAPALTPSNSSAEPHKGIQSSPPSTPTTRHSETPTRRIRTLTPAQLNASEPGLTGLARTPTTAPPGTETGGRVPATAMPAELTTEPGQQSPPTAVSLPGFRFLSCLNQSQLGDLWRAEDSTGKTCRALCLLPFVRYDPRLIAHLQALRDPALPASEVHWSPAERLVVLTSLFDGSLRERFEARQADNHAGIPRQELLRLLRTAAESLDALYARWGLQHLGLSPRNLLIDGQRLWIAEFGVVPLVWIPTGQSAATINARYAAPELFDRRPSRSADQFSLAVIFAEMLTGVHPRPHRPGSGFHRRVSSGRSGGSNRQTKYELNLVPARDRQVILQALHADPDKRFSSCTAFVEALELAGQEMIEPENLYGDLPPVIPYSTLEGEPASPNALLPPVAILVDELTRIQDPRQVPGPQNTRYFVQPDGSWLYHCPLQIFPGALHLKVEGLAAHWHGQIVEKNGECYQLLLDVPIPRSFWERCLQKPRKVEVDIEVDPLIGTHTRLTEARIRVRYTDSKLEQVDRILTTMAPQVFETVRQYLQATQEQRSRDRWPLAEPVNVYPIYPDLNTAAIISGMCKNISYSGISLLLPETPPTDYLYLHLHRSPQALGYAILARVVRRQVLSEGVEIGAVFGTPPRESPASP